ncbi:DUF4430 domain-containing protein [Virgibacillus xinjiangensis]|uniref:DUF4430 domain-containing protein n=1 Tax=Virgibacillus xinjiangensis TaxID=393090 RepID=A0ABV7CRC6_9BACI
MKEKSWWLWLGSLLMVIGLLSGCADEDTGQTDSTADTEQGEAQQSEENEEKVLITLSENEGEEVFTEEEVTIEENAILLDVMKENFEIEEENGFISSINGIGPQEGEERSWMYYVNGEMAMVGAQEYELSPGDEVTFDLQAWE